MLLLGLDIGSSSIKTSLFDAHKGVNVFSAQSPQKEMEIISPNEGWAEQDPEVWYRHVGSAIQSIRTAFPGSLKDIKAIGISYQMHGLVALDKSGNPVRNSIIWCDSRAVSIGNKALESLGPDYCLNKLLNSPGNFTASKLKWVQDHQPEVYDKIDKIMLPGDYIAYRLTGKMATTESGLSEGIFWDFKDNKLSQKLLDEFQIDRELIPEVVPAFGIQGTVSQTAADELGLTPGIPVSYRAGDQPNNALSLNVLEPGEVAATAGTSGVVYGITRQQKPDQLSRVNTFLHVNHKHETPRLGTLLCINGTGILNSWMRHNIMSEGTGYNEMNTLAEQVEAGSDGLLVFPFGNGAERVLENKNPGARILGLDLNRHTRSHLLRASQEGIIYSLIYGIEVMQELGLNLRVIRTAAANMFLSRVFRQSFASLSGAMVEMYKTDGAEGAARGAGIGAGIYKSPEEAFQNLHIIEQVEPKANTLLTHAYSNWKEELKKLLLEN